jgi:hypothetical protein
MLVDRWVLVGFMNLWICGLDVGVNVEYWISCSEEMVG